MPTPRANRMPMSSGIIQRSAAQDNDDVIKVCARLSDVPEVAQETKFTLDNRLKSVHQVSAGVRERHVDVASLPATRFCLNADPVGTTGFRFNLIAVCPVLWIRQHRCV